MAEPVVVPGVVKGNISRYNPGGLAGVWYDSEFDPSMSAVYYAHVIENPSCRWSTYDCNRMPANERPATCSDPNLPKTIQERAWASPTWYSPSDLPG